MRNSTAKFYFRVRIITRLESRSEMVVCWTGGLLGSDKWGWSMGGCLVYSKIVLLAKNLPSLLVCPACIVCSLPWDQTRDSPAGHRAVTQPKKPLYHWSWESLIFSATFMELYACNFPFFTVFVHFYGSSMWTKFNLCDHAMKACRGTGYQLSSTCLWP
jgi:hypothetical protein